ncbi:hypothetical protein KXQ82_00005 [Mucilaginibacter sp. HMF5004]|uniref:hypothetical protein n=1 Tax=Mucilaginibacter rivuli TaxID=2857527 RepID=UPI001C5EC2DE|nr:hypothetical protein [Mucilaginibacter rivuli]MBW4888068.1 hypothetical protein [Mucilaginibacter rivuli]
MADSPTIKFSWLQYNVSDIESLMAAHPSMDSFVFGYLFPESGDALQLVAYVHLSEVNKYDPHYDVLSVYADEPALSVNGPIQLCDNVLAVEDMRKELVDAHGVKADYIIFAPIINAANYVYYQLQAYQNGVGGAKPRRLHEGDDFNTNPSPPAI